MSEPSADETRTTEAGPSSRRKVLESDVRVDFVDSVAVLLDRVRVLHGQRGEGATVVPYTNPRAGLLGFSVIGGRFPGTHRVIVTATVARQSARGEVLTSQGREDFARSFPPN